MAYGKEFKNMLVDLEIARAGEDTYKVNLKTEVPYPDEIKIVKKSDYNYYILLAETYSLVKTTKSSGTIKSIKVDTYPYAEQNFENGFTKVSFNTTRPVDFVVSLSANRASKFPVMDLVRLARLDNLYKENNFDYLNPKYKVAEAKPPVKSAQQETVTAKKETSVPEKVAQAPKKVAQAETKAPVVKQAQKEVVKQVQKETLKTAPVQKPQTVAKVATAPKVDVKKQEQPQKIASAQKIATAQKAPAKTAEASKVTAPQKPVVEKKQPEKQASQTPKVKEQAKELEKSAPKAPVKSAQAPVKLASSDVQSPKEMPKAPEVTENKAPANIELEPIEKIDEEPVQNDFKNAILSFLIGNKTSVLIGLILLVALAVISRMKKKPTNALAPSAISEAGEIQETKNFENVLDEGMKEEVLDVQEPQEVVQNSEEEIKEEEQIAEIAGQEQNIEESAPEIQIIEESATAEQEQNTEITETIAQEETAQEETAQNDEISEEEIKEEEPEIVASVQIEEPTPEELSATEIQEIAQAEIIEEAEETKSPEEIEEEIQQEIRQEIENENLELLDATDESEEEILEVSEIKEEIVSAIGGAFDSLDEEIVEVQEEQNLSVHNLDVINRQAPSGNYDEEDLIELDNIKDELAEIKNNLSKESEAQVETIQPRQEEKAEILQTVAQVEIPKSQPNEVLKSVPNLKPVPELKQVQPKPAQPKKAPIKKAPVARILCKTQIENDRGLYLADYAGNKALVGYVNNNVFVLYNFKKTKIMNNEIIFRLSEAKPKEDLYYVMVDNKKFLIKSEQYRLSLMQKIS